MLVKNNYIFLLKVLILFYILIINLFTHHSFLQIMNSNIVKIILLFLIVSSSFIDITLAILLTIALIMNIILFETKNVIKAKTHVIKKEILKENQISEIKENTLLEKDHKSKETKPIMGSLGPPVASIIPVVTSLIEDDEDEMVLEKAVSGPTNVSGSTTVAGPIIKNSSCTESLPTLLDESMYLNNINREIGDELLPNIKDLDGMQNNIYDMNNYNSYLSPILNELDHNHIVQGIDESIREHKY